MTDPADLPRVTPYLLRTADRDGSCARRLSREFDGARGAHDPVHRSRLRDAFLAAVRDVHAELAAPSPEALAAALAASGADLEAEEQAVLEQAATWYVQLFEDRAVVLHEHGLDTPTVRRGVRVGGWVDLTVVDGDGVRELRQFDLWGGRGPDSDDPVELPAVRLALLRLSSWIGDEPVRVRWADLLTGRLCARDVDLATERPELVEWFEERLDVVRSRVAEPVPTPGDDCGGCKHVVTCPAHRGGAHYGRRRDVLPGIITITPTSLSAWRRCARAWRDQYVLQVPRSDRPAGTFHGLQVHDLLRHVHATGSCSDVAHLDDVLDAHGLGDDHRVRAELTAHAQRCPRDAQAVGHEVTYARFFHHPHTPFMATARIDALWSYDGILDAHDYKTGQVWGTRVAEDEQARLQAWILQPVAAALGARLRVTFEHLSPDVLDDPMPFEPDDDDLGEIGRELLATVEAMRAEPRRDPPFAGVHDVEVCGRCDYRSICPDSAAPGVPTWPRVEPEGIEPEGIGAEGIGPEGIGAEESVAGSVPSAP